MDSLYSSPDKLSKEQSLLVNFACQRCCQPLKLHDTFTELDEQTLLELTTPLYPHPENEKANMIEEFNKKCDDPSVSRKIILPVNLDVSNFDFMIAGESKNNIKINSENSLKFTSALFDLMSDQSDVDHPLCEECTDNLLDQMDHQLRTAEDECKEYREFLERLEMGNADDDYGKLQGNLQELQHEEVNLEKQLKNMEAKEKSLKMILNSIEDEFESLQRERDKQWHEYCRIKRQLLLSEDCQRSVNNQLKYAQVQLDKLQFTNVFNATFHVFHSGGHFGTVNNFRLGRLPNIPVEWAEINAAWGQTTLLLHSLAKKVGLTFKRYRLMPYGNHSYIESLENKSKELPLYCFGGIRYMLDTKFDQAMVAFLDCLQQLKEKVGEGDASFHLPYRMEKGKLEDEPNQKIYSIKLQFNSDEEWTKALKFMLSNLKWTLTWIATQFHSA